jgi:hypothetical protein
MRAPARQDPYKVSGWSAWCSQHSIGEMLSNKDRTTEKRDTERAMLDQIRDLEELYDKEDEEMLTRLIKIRKSLWT